MANKTIFLLLGPKGSGKSFIGKIFEDHFAVPFIQVEHWARNVQQGHDVTDPAYIREVFQVIESGIRSAISDQQAVVFESTGLSDAFDQMLEHLRRDFRVLMIQVRADTDLCLQRIRARDPSVHVPVTEEQIRDINQRVVRKPFSFDFEIDNTSVSADELVIEVRRILEASSTRILPVACAIILHEGRVLVTQRSASMRLPLKWEFPGGKVEPGESPEACLLREIREELGIEIRLTHALTPHDQTYETTTIRLIPFVAEYVSGDIVLAEHAAYRWLDREQLRDLDWAAADVSVLEEFLLTT